MTTNKPQRQESGEETLAAARSIYQKLLTGQQSALLGTVTGDGSPLVSYAPFAADDAKNFYIFISALSAHTANLAQSGEASLMLIADEAASPHIFARERITFQCVASTLARDTAEWNAAAALYAARFNNFFELLRGLNDFRMVRLAPQRGSLVVGFGQAYEIGGAQLDELMHRQS